jgi:hypothetical protein
VLALILVGSLLVIKHLIFNKEKFKGMTSEEILNKAISIIDPTNDWKSRYDGKIRARYITMNAEYDWSRIIEIDNETGYWKNQMIDGNDGWYAKNEEYHRFKVNANNNSQEDEIVKDSILLDRIQWERMHDYCLFGFLMELKGSGLNLDKQITRKKFQGYNCLALTFNSKDSRVPDNYFKEVDCTIYIDQLNYSLKGYTYKDPRKNKDYYCILAGTIIVHQQTIPICRIYYNNSDDSFLGIDIITPAK